MENLNGALGFKATLDIDDFNVSAQAMERHIRQVSTTTVSEAAQMDQSIQQFAQNGARYIVSYLVGQGMSSLLQSIVQTRGEFQQLEIAFGTMLKSDSKAKQLMDELDTSESTIRRDLVAMDKKGYLTKVHGGAIANNTNIHTQDEKVINRIKQNRSEKEQIARYAASLIVDNDFVYIDAGTTTAVMIDYITAKNVVFVTNSLTNAKRISDRGYTVYILGGEFKSTTEAIVGDEAVVTLDKYNFTKGFWGTNGITVKNGFTTPEIKEAMVKKKSMENSKEKYILADDSKFSQVSSIKFADFEDAVIITNALSNDNYKKYKNIKEV